jgi:hypothetical protein
MREGDLFKGLDVDGRVILQWIMKNWFGGHRLG